MQAHPAAVTPPFTENVTISCSVDARTTSGDDANRQPGDTEVNNQDNEIGVVLSMAIKKSTAEGELPIAGINERESAHLLVDRGNVQVTGSLEKTGDLLR